MKVKDLRHAPDEEILRAVIAWRQEHGHWPMISDFRCDPRLPLSLCEQRFGSTEATRQAARILCHELTPGHRSDIELLQPQFLTKLQQAADWLAPRRVTPHSLKATPPHLRVGMADLAHYCGGLDAALRKLGLPVAHPTAQDLIEAIQKAAEELGCTPALNDCGSDLLPYARSCFKRAFITWRAAVAAAGLELRPTGRPKGCCNLTTDEIDFAERKARRAAEQVA